MTDIEKRAIAGTRLFGSLEGLIIALKHNTISETLLEILEDAANRYLEDIR
jgi:hypothetical protein